MRSYETLVTSDSDYYLYIASSTAQKMFFYPICVGYFYYAPQYFLKRDHYDSFLILLLTKGSCTFTTNHTHFTANKGDVVLLDCYAPHQYASDVAWEASWLHFDGPLAREYYNCIVQNSGNILVPRSSQTVEHALNKICNIFRTSSTINEASISKYITNILTELLLSGTAKEERSEIKHSLANTITYINEHFSEPISLDDLAADASLSPFYFTRMFTKETGMTPHQYIIATRINSAKFLLKTTNMPIKEIGFNSGFTSESSFCTTFKKWEHITPSEYRCLDSIN